MTSATTSLRPAVGPLLTDHLRHWATHRAHQRAFTYVDFPEPTSAGLHHTLGWQGLDARARAVAERLANVASPGDRAALLLPQGLHYAAAFLGCLYAGVIAVPLFGPELPGHEGRLLSVLADCEPVCALTDTATAPSVEALVRGRGAAPLAVVRVDLPYDRSRPPAPQAARPDRDDIAYLQYTSGSTRSPAGVVISHANVVANAVQAIEAFDADAARSTTVGWLPLFHDMGLVLSVAAPVVGGFPSVLMDPVAFLEDPSRWLRLLGSYPGTISAAPNFAYDYCVSRTDRDQAGHLRLDRVKVLINGSEPVRPATVERFRAAFADAGLAAEAQCPAYGLAEATVFVTNDAPDAAPRSVSCDRDALARGRIVLRDASDPAATQLVGCGTPAGQELRIADPDTGVPLGDDEVGEIVLRGPNIGHGYFKRAELTAATFGVRAPGAPPGPETGWLRTGDLGAVHDGVLLVTGRLKDLIVVDGRNHYPQDIEETVQSAVPAIRRDRLAAFAVPRADGTGDEVVVVAEHRRGTELSSLDERVAARLARAAVSAGHGLRLAQLRIVPPGTVPRTSSGKIARAACRTRWSRDGFAGQTPAGGREVALGVGDPPTEHAGDGVAPGAGRGDAASPSASPGSGYPPHGHVPMDPAPHGHGGHEHAAHDRPASGSPHVVEGGR